MLPTLDDYLKNHNATTNIQISYPGYCWVEAGCSKCAHQLMKNETLVLTSYPAQYQYFCPHCGNVETSILNLPSSLEF